MNRLTNHCKACNRLMEDDGGYQFDDDLCEECSLVIEYIIEQDLNEEE